MIRQLAGNCFFVDGYKMNLIFDSQNKAWYHIKENLEEILSIDLESSMKKYLEDFGIIIQYPEFLKDSFINVNTNYFSPQICESLIVDYNKKSKFDILSIFKKLDCLNISSLQLRFFELPNPEYVKEIILELDNYTYESVEIIIPYDIELIKLFEFDDFLMKSIKVYRVFLHSCGENFVKTDLKKVYYSLDKIINDSFCGQISPFEFSQNPKHFFKSKNFNSCLYKKLGIDVYGNIKNCPSLPQVLGNIMDDNLDLNLDSLTTSKIKKDEIDVCKDCEFRYICTDCRAFTDSNSRPNARPSKCQYNPYISKWSHEDEFISFEDCGVISNEDEFSIDHEKIALINKEIWGE